MSNYAKSRRGTDPAETETALLLRRSPMPCRACSWSRVPRAGGDYTATRTARMPRRLGSTWRGTTPDGLTRQRPLGKLLALRCMPAHCEALDADGDYAHNDRSEPTQRLLSVSRPVMLGLRTRDGGVAQDHGAWRSLVAHLLWEQGVGGSNPSAPTIPWSHCARSSTGVEHRPSKPRVAGSSPAGRAIVTDHGERSSAGRAPDCGSGGRGFESHRSPQATGR